MRILKTSLCLISALLLIFASSPYAIAGIPTVSGKNKTETTGKSIIVTKISRPPFLDGIAVDECWQQTPATKISIINGGKPLLISLKACRNNKKVYFLIQYPTEKEDRKHQSWHWDPVQQAYIPGNEKEETFTIILAQQKQNNKKADIWIWRAARTDPVNKADDLIYQQCDLVDFPKKSISMDKGENCWFSKYFGDFAGEELPRFYNKTPKGSLADVSAKGSWDMNYLSIEFSRLLNTRNQDDIQLQPGRYYIQILRGTPEIQDIDNDNFIPLLIK